jgi:hypothetical protein
VGQARANKLAGLPQHQRDDGKSRIRGSGGGLHAASDLSLFLAVVTMLFVIVLMVLAPVTTFVAVIAVLIAAIGVIFVALTIVGNVGIVVPVISNKVDRLAAGVVLATVLTPIPFAVMTLEPESTPQELVSRAEAISTIAARSSASRGGLLST